MIDRNTLASELIELFGVWTKECVLKEAAARGLKGRIPKEILERGLENAAVRLLEKYPITKETMAGWEEFFARKDSFVDVFARAEYASLNADAKETKPMASSATCAAPLVKEAEKKDDKTEKDLGLQKLQEMKAIFSGKKIKA